MRPWLGALVCAVALSLAACGSSSPATTPSGTAATSSGAAATPTTQPARSSAPIGPSPSRTNGVGIAPIQGGPTGPAHADPAAAAQSSPPVRVRIPSIGVNSALDRLGIVSGGVLETPPHFPVAAWYAGGVRPGDTGPAIIAGHVDSVSGPAVFFRLRDLKPGALVFVDRADGSTVRFTVARTDEYPKRKFPTAAVYGPSPLPTLRLVTCTGDFDRAKRSYVDNLVVTAYLG